MVALPHFKGFLAMPAIRDYIVDNLLNNNVLLADILEDTQINVLNKLRMIEKYPMFVKAVEIQNTKARLIKSLVYYRLTSD
jgi:hypothetical protein